MELTDYTGKLNDHESYLDILNKIDKKCEYIEVVILDERESNDLIEEFRNDIISVKKSKRVVGNRSGFFRTM